MSNRNCSNNNNKLTIVCQIGILMGLFEINRMANQIAKIRFTNGAISRPKTAIKLAMSLGIFNQDKNRKAVVNR